MTISKSRSAERVQYQDQKKAGTPAAEKSRPEKMSLEDLGAAILARTQELESRMELNKTHPEG